jgi:hypothetical protein
METNQNQENQSVLPVKPSQEEMLLAIYENTRKTKNYMKWQLYITLILVVLPLLAALFLVPVALSSLNSAYLAPLQTLQ